MKAISYVKSTKSFPSHKAHRMALICISLSSCQPPAYTAKPYIQG